MRHLGKSRRFKRKPAHRKAMFVNLATSLFVHERILTTVERAKELRRVAEKLITLGKRGDLAARRLAASRLKNESHRVGQRVVFQDVALKKLFDTIAPRFKDRPGGYTRIIRTGQRLGDNAAMALIELLPDEKAKATEAGKKDAKKTSVKGTGAGKATARRKAASATSKKAAAKGSGTAKTRSKTKSASKKGPAKEQKSDK